MHPIGAGGIGPLAMTGSRAAHLRPAAAGSGLEAGRRMRRRGTRPCRWRRVRSALADEREGDKNRVEGGSERDGVEDSGGDQVGSGTR